VALAGAAAVGLILAPATAGASAIHGSHTPHIVRAIRWTPKPIHAGANSGSQCLISVGHYTGGLICGTNALTEFWSYGQGQYREEVFIVGWDSAIWHIWQRYPGDPAWSGWYSLGGGALNGVWQYNSLNIIEITGLDSNPWCDAPAASPSGWSGWYQCNAP
jgi:hypothetical protein